MLAPVLRGGRGNPHPADRVLHVIGSGRLGMFDTTSATVVPMPGIIVVHDVVPFGLEPCCAPSHHGKVNRESCEGSMRIGEAGKMSGVSAKMIRHYEQIGLVPNADRRGNTYRDYSHSDVHRLQFIRRARDLGFSIHRIRDLLRLWSDHARSNAEVKALALKHVHELETRIAEMREMAQTLHRLADACDGSGRPDCPILEQLNGTAHLIDYKLQKAS